MVIQWTLRDRRGLAISIRCDVHCWKKNLVGSHIAKKKCAPYVFFLHLDRKRTKKNKIPQLMCVYIYISMQPIIDK